MIGQVFGNYKIEQKLGEGGMGEVFRGVDMMLEREVAIKFLRPELASQAQVVERFRSEAVTLAKLNHPNIATLFNFMRQGDSFIMVLEFVRGVTLDHVIQQRGAIPVDQAIPIFCQVLDGIQEAHNYGIIHRDIKPANMMLTEKGTLKVLDFGIARILGTARMTRQGNIIGTIEYMSPEQVRGFDTDARSDIYSLGMLLYEMLTRRCPFDMQNEFELMKAQIEQYPIPPRQINPAIPESVEQAIWKAIAKDPAQRFQSASEFRGFLLNAGFAATGRLEPLAVGDPSAYGTRPVTQPPLSNPPSPFATVPMQAGYPSPSQPGTSTPSQPGASLNSHPGLMPPPQASNPGIAADPMAATFIEPPQQHTNAASSKETRIGTPAPQHTSAAGGKETRIGTAPQQPQAFAPQQQQQHQQQGFAPQQHQQQHAAQKKSFMSSLTWVHFAGAGVVGLVAIGLVIGLGIFALSGSKKGKEPVKPAALAEEPVKPTTPPAEQPAQAADQTQPAGGTGASAADANVPGAGASGTTVIPIEQPPATSGGGTVAASGSTQGASRPVQKAPAPPKPKPADSGDAARKRREAALRALDQ